MKPYYEDDSVTIYHGDALVVLPDIRGWDIEVGGGSPGVSKASLPARAEHLGQSGATDLTPDAALRLIQECAVAADPGQPVVEIENIIAIAARAGVEPPSRGQSEA